MFKKSVAQPLALAAALLLGAQPALAADDGNTVALHGPDGSVRTFTIDSDHVLQKGSGGAAGTQVRKASATERKALKSLRSKALTSDQDSAVIPVLRDAAGRAWGLPGGLIVTLHTAVSEEEGRAQLEAAGLVPEQRIAPNLWVVQSPAGLPSIEQANALNAKGLFADVVPNWWNKRTLK